MPPESTPIKNSPGIIIYDGTCGVCSTTRRRFDHYLSRVGFETVPSQDAKVKPMLPPDFVGEPSEVLVLIPDSSTATGHRLIGGIDATFYIASHFWFLKPLVWIGKLPGFHWVADRFYKAIAKRRYQISRVCRLRPDIQRIGDVQK